MGHSLKLRTNLLTDAEAPIINPCPSDIKIISLEASHTLVLPAVTVTDNVGVDKFTTNYPNGSEVTWGEYNITYTASDKAGNKAHCNFRITIAGKHISSSTRPLFNVRVKRGNRLYFCEIGSEKEKKYTVESRSTDTRLIRTPGYCGQFRLS